MAIPHGGVPVGFEVAKALNLPFEIAFSKRIKHPANSDLSIGAVSVDDVVLDESTQFIPQNYVLHQVAVLQRQLKNQFEQFYEGNGQTSLSGKTVIVVDDVLRQTDELNACLQSIRKQGPAEIIIAVAVTTTKAAHLIHDNEHRLYYLFMELQPQSKACTYFPAIEEHETKRVLHYFREKSLAHQ
jgi:predicted phosphoribosyltransferase